jgi:hypothetical protein
MKKMSKFAFLLLGILCVFSSCEKGVNPNDPIGLSAAFSYCSTLTTYWVWAIVITIVCGIALYEFYKQYKKSGYFNAWVLFALLVLLLAAWLYAPSEVAWNTTVEQAGRGTYIR